jgi:hypothetical protein
MPEKPPILSDLDFLLSAFRPKVDLMLLAMAARGFKTRVFETRRSRQRAHYLASIGKSKNGALSMHCLDAALDCVDAEKLWDNPAFFRALGQESQKIGLTWGGDWDGNPNTKETFVDSPHVQAIPLRLQNRFRALRTVEERNAFILRCYA